jgi:hypothetical protein
MPKSKRFYDTEPPDTLEDWMKLLGSEYTIQGMVFGGADGTVAAFLPSVTDDIGMRAKFPTLEQWSEMLKISDQPRLYERDGTGTLKGWLRKSQYIISGAVQQRTWVRDGLQCLYCGAKMGEHLLTIDHFVPLQLGGANEPGNYVTACRNCNKSKGAREPRPWCEANNVNVNALEAYLGGHIALSEYLEVSPWSNQQP